MDILNECLFIYHLLCVFAIIEKNVSKNKRGIYLELIIRK